MVLRDLLMKDNIKKYSYIVKEDDQNIYKALTQYESGLLDKSKAITDINAKMKDEIYKILTKNAQAGDFSYSLSIDQHILR